MCYGIMKMGGYYAYQTTIVALDYPLVIFHHQVDHVFRVYEMTNKY